LSRKGSDEGRLNPKEKDFLERLLANGVEEITPTETTESIIFEGLRSIEGDYSDDEIRNLLRSLTLKNYFRAEEYDRVILCPKCGSIHLHTRYTCPRCNSSSVSRRELLEHPQCGYIGEKEEFQEGGGLVCPSCGTELKQLVSAGSDNGRDSYHLIGTSFNCKSCGNNFQRPNFLHNCLKCGMRFNYKIARYEKLNTYRLTEKVNQLELERVDERVEDRITQILLGYGFEVESNSTISGQSGVSHRFDIIARKHTNLLVGDIVRAGDQQDLISILGKKIDINADLTLLVDISGKIKAPELEENHRILVIKPDEDFEGEFMEYLEEEQDPDIKLGETDKALKIKA
jgi:hypothetical protein